MKDSAPQTIRLADYTPPAYLVDTVSLIFRLDPNATRVTSRIAFRPNPDAVTRDFFLHGEELDLKWARIDGMPAEPVISEKGLTCAVPDAPFVWEAEVEIAPARNTALEGLYMSNGMYCTQCEAEGFRKITYYPDRPDVMGIFTVRIESDLPVLLSNGNATDQGNGWAEWHDPWPKPAYLFALVAGELVAHADRFTTLEGRDVALNIWVRPGDLDKCAFGMRALKSSMAWDEATYGRAYDLDVFNIVAVDDFNMGAMENKGLNIFNSSCVLANPETSTDADFERIEAIIAHEYFHNWTGNRITCRDWFQLCLKEGLTVFRDQSFTGDLRGHAVKRIDDAQLLRARQFREDAGPLAHPVRPASFVEINNFYTVTVYEKGAELVGMLKRLVGAEGYDAALALYFDRHDGQAVTIEDWLACFADATGRDLTQFARWYEQAGTPVVTATESHADGTFALTLRQETPPTPGQPDKAPVHIPVAVGLLAPDGTEVLPTRVLELTEAEQTFTFPDLPERPIASLLRDFSAPVILRHDQSPAERALLLANDTDPFNRWQAGRALARAALLDRLQHGADPDPAFLDGLKATLTNDTLDPAFRARVLTLPSEEELTEAVAAAGRTPDPMQIHETRADLRDIVGAHLHDALAETFAAMQIAAPYDPGAEQAGMRTLGNLALSYLTHLEGPSRARSQFEAARDMTQQLGALSSLLDIRDGGAELARFRDRWQDDRLVMNKWFSLQIARATPAEAAPLAAKLAQDPAFDWKNPNRFRSVFGALAGHPAGFHAPGGAAYDLLVDWLIRLDPVNPQTAARMVTAFETWARYDADRQAAMRHALERLRARPDLSRDSAEMVSRILG
ncbi:aminopeptidase N [Salipiger sp. IMCC34102]|uniref:aminopeptidase N n=1 Tax=Salipiger sp. IMCC34102 TaxID=2510647 RepID=UPI00101C229B|nr:aminopeptidase N [Salipiger sp. IMCC34102]RYH02708.1 aminopeptidase N [Salipiger sp. IMCC34102]